MCDYPDVRAVPAPIRDVSHQDAELARLMHRAYLHVSRMPPTSGAATGAYLPGGRSPWLCTAPCRQDPHLEIRKVRHDRDPEPVPRSVWGAAACPCGDVEFEGPSCVSAVADALRLVRDRIVRVGTVTVQEDVVKTALAFLFWVMDHAWDVSPDQPRFCVDPSAWADTGAPAQTLQSGVQVLEARIAGLDAAVGAHDPDAYCGKGKAWHSSPCCRLCVPEALCEAEPTAAPLTERLEAFLRDKEAPKRHRIADGWPDPMFRGTESDLERQDGRRLLIRGGGPGERVNCAGDTLVTYASGEARDAAVKEMEARMRPDGTLEDGTTPVRVGRRVNVKEAVGQLGAAQDVVQFKEAYHEAVRLLRQVRPHAARRWSHLKRVGEAMLRMHAAVKKASTMARYGLTDDVVEAAIVHLFAMTDLEHDVWEGKVAAPEAEVWVPFGFAKPEGECAEGGEAARRAARTARTVDLLGRLRRRGEWLAKPAQASKDRECGRLFGEGHGTWVEECGNCLACPVPERRAEVGAEAWKRVYRNQREFRMFPASLPKW